MPDISYLRTYFLSSSLHSSKTVGGSCLTWLAIVLTSLAFFASLATIASCEYVRHENDDPDVADSETTTAGIYCFDTSIFDSWSQLGSTTVRIFVQVVAAIATFLGLVMVIMLWKTTRKPHGKCYHRTMGFFSEYICPFKRSTTYKNHIN